MEKIQTRTHKKRSHSDEEQSAEGEIMTLEDTSMESLKCEHREVERRKWRNQEELDLPEQWFQWETRETEIHPDLTNSSSQEKAWCLQQDKGHLLTNTRQSKPKGLQAPSRRGARRPLPHHSRSSARPAPWRAQLHTGSCARQEGGRLLPAIPSHTWVISVNQILYSPKNPVFLLFCNH